MYRSLKLNCQSNAVLRNSVEFTFINSLVRGMSSNRFNSLSPKAKDLISMTRTNPTAFFTEIRTLVMLPEQEIDLLIYLKHQVSAHAVEVIFESEEARNAFESKHVGPGNPLISLEA